MSTTRAVLYTRYSNDKQRETSTADQLRAAQARAEREGWTVVATHSDEGVSGSIPVALRPGGKALLANTLAGRFDVLLLEGLDRLSREVGEAEQMVKRLEHRGIRIVGIADGYDTEACGRKVMRLARGMVNELYLDDLRAKTHRGLAGQFFRGFSAGGRSYGYRTEEAGGGRRMKIDEREATIVREVFRLFADGHSTRAIAHELNRRGVPSSRGGTWAVSALQGSSTKGLGMLHNELYIGRVIWNRRQWLKDPDTGARRYVDRPRDEWQVREAPELRIIDQDLWVKVQTRARTGPPRGTRTGRGAIPKSLFGGLLHCATCGAAVVAINRERYGCSAHKDRGPAVCSSGATVLRDTLDKRLIAELRDELLAPDALDELQGAVRSLMAGMRRDAAGDQAGARRRIQVLQGEIARLVDAIAAMGLSEALQVRLRAAEVERDALDRQLDALQVPAPAKVIEDVTARYRRLVLRLQQVLEGDCDRDRTRQILAEMLGPVAVGRDAETGENFAELEDPAGRLLVAAAGESLGVVAGARNVYRRRLRLWS